MGLGVGIGEAVGVPVGVAVAVGVGVAVADVTVIQDENSEVLPFGSVAAAVAELPEGTATSSRALIGAVQFGPVVTCVEPRKVLP